MVSRSDISVPLTLSEKLKACPAKLTQLTPGLFLTALATALAFGLSQTLGGPVMLYAILIGMTFNPWLYGSRTYRGVGFSAKTILNIGVALLGAKIALVDIAALGFQTTALVLSCVAGTLLSGIAVGRLFGMKSQHAILSSGAVAICGASAAMALCAAIPDNEKNERNTLLTVMGVTVLSTLAMIAYPAIAYGLGLSDTQAGIFIGATIHNVAQVVGAGFMISETAGDTATIVKLMRVACLVPVVALVALAYRRSATASSACGDLEKDKRPPLIPGFLIGFVALVALNSIGLIPTAATVFFGELSHYALVFAIAALGIKTSLRDMLGAGPQMCMILIIQTALLALCALCAVMLIPAFS